MNVVETFELSKHFSGGRVKALQNFTLTVEQGKIFSLLGPNGAGKTTLIKVLIGILHPTTGSARVLEKSINDYRIHDRIGYLAENHRFPGFLSARHVLHYYGKMGGLSATELRDKIPELLRLVKMGKWIDVKIRKYSKGMMQRMGVAHALLNDPDLIFLDEPTDGIDPVGRHEIRDILMQLRDRGKTIFLNSHLLSEVERLSDEVAILKEGKLLQKGSVEDFISIDEQYQLKLLGEGRTIEEVFREQQVPVSKNDEYHTIAVKDEQQLNFLIDKLRQADVVIQAILPRRISLEDYFINVIAETAKDD